MGDVGWWGCGGLTEFIVAEVEVLHSSQLNKKLQQKGIHIYVVCPS